MPPPQPSHRAPAGIVIKTEPESDSDDELMDAEALNAFIKSETAKRGKVRETPPMSPNPSFACHTVEAEQSLICSGKLIINRKKKDATSLNNYLKDRKKGCCEPSRDANAFFQICAKATGYKDGNQLRSAVVDHVTANRKNGLEVST